MTQHLQAEIIKEIKAAFEREARIDAKHYPIHVIAENDRLVLEGTVINIAAKKLAMRIAQRVSGALPILDRLRVSAAEPQQDGKLRDEVILTLTQEPVFTEYGVRVKQKGEFEVLREGRTDFGGIIDIEIHDGTVNLAGRVGSLTHRRLAEVLAWWTAGCEVVENRLRVVPPEKENDGELSDAVRMVLEKDPLVHSGQISVDVCHGEVVLNGYVPSLQEKQLAVLDAWYVPGVREVVDHIQARR